MSEINIGKDFKYDLDNLGIGQSIGDNNKIDSANKLRYLTAEEISVFNALDADGNGSLSKNEVDKLKENVTQYTKDDNDFSRRDAKKLAKELGVNAKALMSLLQKLCSLHNPEKVHSFEDGNTTGFEETISGNGKNNVKKITFYNNKTGKIERTWTYNEDDIDEENSTINSYTVKDADGKPIESRREYENGLSIYKEYENGELSKKITEREGVKETENYYEGRVSDRKISTEDKEISYTYLDNGDYTEYTKFNKPKDGIQSVFKRYNTNGKVAYEEKTNENGTAITTEYRYDDSGKRTGSTSTNKYGEQMICGSGGIVRFKLIDDTVYPCNDKSLIEKFKCGEKIEDYLVK